MRSFKLCILLFFSLVFMPGYAKLTVIYPQVIDLQKTHQKVNSGNLLFLQKANSAVLIPVSIQQGIYQLQLNDTYPYNRRMTYTVTLIENTELISKPLYLKQTQLYIQGDKLCVALNINCGI